MYRIPSMSAEFRLRTATAADLEVILRHRRRMFEDDGFRDAAVLDAVAASSEPFIARGLRDGSYRGWLAENGSGHVVAGGGLVVHPWLGHPSSPQPRRAYVLNVYTEPEYRRRGLARRLMQAIVEWCRQEGFAYVALHASDHGRALYEKLGFKATNEMRLDLK